MKNPCIIGIIILFVCFMKHARPAEIILKDNGYENVLVAIADAVPEDPAIIEGIKEIFTDGSQKLFRATRYRAYFRNVTILIPSTWTKKPNYEARTSDQTFRDAALRIDEPYSKYPHRPYALGYGTCGRQGLYIHLTPKFVTDKAFATGMAGPPGKTLVHEWGHLRWGLADEYPTDVHYYQHEDTLYPTACHRDIPGTDWNPKAKRRCIRDPKTQLLERDCRFIPNTDQKDFRASYMFMQFLTNIEDFCDHEKFGDPKITHNAMAPNKHNTRCGGQSSWEVMLQSKDFKNNNNPPAANKNLDTTPNFRFVYHLAVKVVLLFDVSTSMLGAPITMMQQAANNLVSILFPDGSFIGIVSFSTGARTVARMKEIKNTEDRRYLSRKLPRTAGGLTAIGLGMKHAISLLISHGGESWAKGASVVLMTDGQNNQPPHPLTVIPTAKKYGIAFHTIAYSNAADKNLEKIAKETGGKSYFSTTSVTSASLFNSLSAIAAEYEGGGANTKSTPAFTVANFAKQVTHTQALKGKFAIDATIGKDTVVTFSYLTKSAVLEVRLEAPDGSAITKTDTNSYQVDSTNQIIRIYIPGIAQIGEWVYTVTTYGISTVVLVNVQSKSRREGQKPIRIQSWFGDKTNTLGGGVAAQVSIFAMVSRGYDPVIGMKVTATIEGSDDTKEVILTDKGYGVDLEADDGTYSAKFGRRLLNQGGRYSITINADNPGNTAKIASTTTSSTSSSAVLNDRSRESSTTYQNIGPIQRVVSAGELKVEQPSFQVFKDVIPPPMIRDLKVISLDIDQGKVTLVWTAVGDDVSTSNQTTYDLRIGSFKEIKAQFENSTRISLLVTPKESGEKEEHEINVSGYKKMKTLYLAIRVIDEAGNKGDHSNIITVAMVPPTKFSNGDEIHVERPSSTLGAIADVMGILAGIVGALAFAVFVVVVVAVIVWLRRRRKTSSPQNQRQPVVRDVEQPAGFPLSNPVFDAGRF